MKLTESKFVVFLGTITFLAVGFWGLYSMPMDEYGNMNDCPFMKYTSSLCQMSATEHIRAWQTLFVATPQKLLNAFLAMVLLLSVTILFTIYWRWYLWRLRLATLHRFYTKEYLSLSFFNYLKEAFSQGILHSRIYA